MNRLQSWTADSWNALAWSRKYHIRQGLFHKRSEYYIKQAGNPDRALLGAEITSTIVGPLVFKRVVTLSSSMRTVQLHLGIGLALGTGMPPWLRSAFLCENSKRLGDLAITTRTVTYQPITHATPILIWNLDLPLLKYTGPDQAYGYGAVQLSQTENPMARMLVPRLNSVTPRLESKYPLIKNVASSLLTADHENGLMALLALVVFCLDVATQWQLSMEETRPNARYG